MMINQLQTISIVGMARTGVLAGVVAELKADTLICGGHHEEGLFIL